MFLMGHTVYSPLNKLRLLKNRNLICHTKNTKGLRGPIDSPLCVRASVSHRLSLEPYDGIFWNLACRCFWVNTNSLHRPIFISIWHFFAFFSFLAFFSKNEEKNSKPKLFSEVFFVVWYVCFPGNENSPQNRFLFWPFFLHFLPSGIFFIKNGKNCQNTNYMMKFSEILVVDVSQQM